MSYPNEHAARVVSPEKFEKDSFRRINIAPGIDIIVGHLKGETTMTAQTYRFDAKKYTPEQAKEWLKKHDIKPIEFEPASGKDALSKIINQTGEMVDIYLYGVIGEDIDGNLIAEQIRNFDASGVKIINEHINSEGGGIVNGLSIAAANLNCKNSKIYTYNDGLAGSMAGIIHQTGSKKFGASYSLLMMHEPSLGEDTIANTKDPVVKKTLQSFKNQLLSILFASTGFPMDKLEKMMTDETWMNAEECEKMGFISPGCIMEFPNKPTIKQGTPAKEILNIVNRAFNLNSNKMEQTTCAGCGEKFDFEEGKETMTCPGCKAKVNAKGEVIKDSTIDVTNKVSLDEIKNLSDKINSLTNLVNGLKKENETLKAESDQNKRKVAETVLDKAIEEGKLVATVKDSFLKKYATDPEGLKELVDAIPMPHNSISGVIDRSQEDAPIPGGYKTLRELEKKDPKLAEKFATENPAAYDKLYKAEYK